VWASGAGLGRPRNAGIEAPGCGHPDKDGAPRPMKMGNIASPWRYDAAIRHALQLAELRRPSIQYCAS